MIWRGQILGYRLLARRRKITVGPSKRATFVTPPLEGKSKFLLLQPRARRLRAAPRLGAARRADGGRVRQMAVADVASRDVDLARGDKAKLVFADGSDLRIELRWVDPPDYIPRPRVRDPQMVQITVGTSIVLGVLAAVLTFLWEKTEPKPPLALDAQPRGEDRGTGGARVREEGDQEGQGRGGREVQGEGRPDQARQGEGRPHRPQRRHPQGHHHPQGEGRHPAREGPEGRHPQHHRPREAARLGPLQAVRAEQRRRAGDGRHGGRQDGRRPRRRRPHHQRLGLGRRRHRLRPHLRRRATSTPAGAARTATAAAPSSPSAASTRSRSASARAAARPTARCRRSRSTRWCARTWRA